jgi:phosphatidylinositol dimannoside acyltransferase
MNTDDLTYYAYATGWSMVRRMPERAAYGMFDRIADGLWRKRGGGVLQLERNLARVTGLEPGSSGMRALSRDGMRSYMRYWCDTFRLPAWSREEAAASFRMADAEALRASIRSGRGVVCPLPHMGNWDHAGVWASLDVAPVMSVAERLKPVQLYDAFVDYRRGLGMDILGLGESGVYEGLVERLNGGGLVCLLGDRDLTAKGVTVDFFGEKTRFPAGPAALAIDTGAALHPVILYRKDGYNSGNIVPEIPIPSEGTRKEKIEAVTQAIADVFAAGIAEHPEDWHMLQKLWLADLDQARLAASDRAGGRP